MKKQKVLTSVVTASLVLIGALEAGAQSGPSYPYFQAVTNLNPAGYWPMHEVEAPMQGDVETNYGSLGLLGTGFYTDWVTGQGQVGMRRNAPGALAGDSDKAVYFTETASNGGSTTNSVNVPHSSPLATLNPPFSVECWFYPTNTHQGDIWSQNGYEGLNAGNSGGGAGNVCGMRLYWQGTTFTVYTYANSSTLNGFSGGAASVGNWYHVVVTDDGTNIDLFVNGNNVGTHPQTSGWYLPDSWTPIEVGNGRGNSRAVNGIVDEFAVYTNVIQDISDHYTAGTSTSPNPTYFQEVTNDNPTIYLRMDAAPYTAPALATWPVVTNYGTLGVNGVYTPGTVPNLLAGPANPNGILYGGVSGNVPQLSGVSSFADVGNSSVFNPVGLTPFSVALLFRGNPCDNRFQNMIGHSDNSWRLAMNSNGKLQASLGTNSPAVVNSAKIYNDGLWHHLVEVYSPGATPTTPGTNSMYVDGVLDTAVATVTTNGIGPGSPLDLMIGADPQYTNNAVGVGRQFAGQVCEVAYFTNSLSAGQVGALYNALGITPGIIQQPISATANQNSAFTNKVVATGATPLSYLWYKDNVPQLTQTNASFVLNSVQPGDASANYYVVVSNNFGSITSAVWSLTVNTSASITSQFPVPYTNQFTLYSGANPTFSVTALGATPLYYQWYSNNIAVPNATNSSFTMSDVQIGLLTAYCMVSNVAGSTSSAPYQASVVAEPSVLYPQIVLGDHPIAYWRFDEPDDTLGDGNTGAVANDYAGGNDGIYTNVVLSVNGYSTADLDTAMAVGTQNINLSYMGQVQGINFAQPTNHDGTMSIEAWVNGVQTGNNFAQTGGSGIVCLGYGNGGEQFCLDTGGSSNSFRFYFRDAGGASHTANGNTNFPSADGKWHHLVGILDEPNKLEYLWIDGKLAQTTALAANGMGILADNAPTNRFTIGWRNNSTSTPTTPSLQFQGDIDEVSIYNYPLSASQVLQHYTSAGVAPSFSVQPPANVTANANGTLSLPTEVIGTAPLGYQWVEQNGNTVLASGTTNGYPLNAGLTINNLPPGYNGDTLQLTVTNAYGTLTYSIALTVLTNAPVITQDLPVSTEAPVGKVFTYSIGVEGPAPYYYQWFSGSAPVSGQTNSTYSFPVGAVGTVSSYFVVVSNIYGAVTSTVSTLNSVAQLTNSYASTILQLHPAGYWPLQEKAPTAPLAMETNYGTLGAVGNAYYAITTASQNNVQFQQTGALGNSGDNDPSVAFAGPSGTNYAFVPRVSPALTIVAPFTMETWMFSSSLVFSDMISESGNGLDAPVNAGNWGGPRLSYAGNNGGGPALQLYCADGQGTARPDVTTPPNSLPINQWHHCVATYDGTTTDLYVDGVLLTSDSTTLAGNATMAPDYWTPLTIGDGFWQGNTGRAYTGSLDEVAIYNYLLSSNQVSAHYAAGTTSGSNYMQTILNDRPELYYRMDCIGYTNESSSEYPVAVNYGTASVNGDYIPGVVPGGLAGPPISALGTNSVAAPINGILSCVDAGNDPTFNPVGTQPFTAMTWFKCYPSDVRSQAIMGHGDANWALNLDGTTGLLIWNTYTGGQVTSSSVLNDGTWHLAAGVVDGTNSYLYIDGTLNASAPLATGGLTSEASANLYLGGDSDFTIVGNNQRYFGGALAHAAFFTNALSAAQIKEIYQAASPATPMISIARSGNNVVIMFTGVLRSSSSANGPFTVVPGATSPYMVSPTAAQQYYAASSQ